MRDKRIKEVDKNLLRIPGSGLLKVFVVLEHALGRKAARIHGSYLNREYAEIKQAKIRKALPKAAAKLKGHISVLEISVRDAVAAYKLVNLKTKEVSVLVRGHLHET